MTMCLLKILFKKNDIYLGNLIKIYNFVNSIIGHVAERLGSGLQNQLQRFESARDLWVSMSYEINFS